MRMTFALKRNLAGIFVTKQREKISHFVSFFSDIDYFRFIALRFRLQKVNETTILACGFKSEIWWDTLV